MRLLFISSLITLILSTINSLSLNYPVSSRFRTLFFVLSLKRLSPVISLPSYAATLEICWSLSDYMISVQSEQSATQNNWMNRSAVCVFSENRLLFYFVDNLACWWLGPSGRTSVYGEVNSFLLYFRQYYQLVKFKQIQVVTSTVVCYGCGSRLYWRCLYCVT